MTKMRSSKQAQITRIKGEIGFDEDILCSARYNLILGEIFRLTSGVICAEGFRDSIVDTR